MQTDSLRKEVEVSTQLHERDVDRKDAMLQMLDRDLDEAEEQYQLALRQHLRHIDTLVELQVCVCVCVCARDCAVDGLCSSPSRSSCRRTHAWPHWRTSSQPS